MKRAVQYSFITIGLFLVLGGCKTIRGGGWIDSFNKNGDEKATFGINITCKNSEFYGQFTYQDHGYKVEMSDGKMRKLSLKAQVDRTAVKNDGSCSDYSNKSFPYYLYDFTYLTHPDESGGEGSGQIELYDEDLALTGKDRLCIGITTGLYAGYYNCGDLGGGNLTIN